MLRSSIKGEENTGKNTEEIITFNLFWWEIAAYGINIIVPRASVLASIMI